MLCVWTGVSVVASAPSRWPLRLPLHLMVQPRRSSITRSPCDASAAPFTDHVTDSDTVQPMERTRPAPPPINPNSVNQSPTTPRRVCPQQVEMHVKFRRRPHPTGYPLASGSDALATRRGQDLGRVVPAGFTGSNSVRCCGACVWRQGWRWQRLRVMRPAGMQWWRRGTRHTEPFRCETLRALTGRERQTEGCSFSAFLVLFARRRVTRASAGTMAVTPSLPSPARSATTRCFLSPSLPTSFSVPESNGIVCTTAVSWLWLSRTCRPARRSTARKAAATGPTPRASEASVRYVTLDTYSLATQFRIQS